MDYADYRHLLFERDADGVVLITINRPDVLNATNARLHWELTQVWRTLDGDPAARVALVTGAGEAFSAGGDLEMVEAVAGNPAAVARTMREAADLVYNMIDLDKPVVSAINGVAVGAGLVVALLADVSIMSETARLTDGHTRLGVAAGDHAAILWPLLCGMAKAKYYLLDCGLRRRPRGRAHRAGEPVRAARAADGDARATWRDAWPPEPARDPLHQARANNWLRQAGPIFDQIAGARDADLYGRRTCSRACAHSARSVPALPLRAVARVAATAPRSHGSTVLVALTVALLADRSANDLRAGNDVISQ